MFNSFKNETESTNGTGKPVDSSAATSSYQPPASSYSTTSGSSPYSSTSSSASSSTGTKGNQPNHSIVDENLTMKGDLESAGDIMVKGKVIGNITCNLLIIDRDALVEGGINANEVIVRGRIKGKVDADRVRLERTADVDCDIIQKSFAAEEGARIKGTLSFKTEGSAASSGSKVSSFGSASGSKDDEEAA